MRVRMPCKVMTNRVGKIVEAYLKVPHGDYRYFGLFRSEANARRVLRDYCLSRYGRGS